MIASPGDVEAERNIAREVVHEWNVIHAEHRKLVLLPIGWDSHASPLMGARPQEIINRQVLDKGDLLVGIFWTRIGTATGEYASGTVEEIERHVDGGKPAMLYFSNRPAHPDSVDPQQYAQLKAFRETCKQKGLCELYENLSDFKEKFFRHLQLKLNDPAHFPVASRFAEELRVVASPETAIPSISSEAQTLLVEASNDPNGSILYVKYVGGTDLQSNGKSFIPNKDRRTIAKWESALQELVDEALVVARGYKGEMYEITSKGYTLADVLKEGHA
jgi:hypothetical protein